MQEYGSFKQYARGVRNLVAEEGFTSGMQYTEQPLDTGYSRNLVNFNFRDDGASLVPRGGFEVINSNKTITTNFKNQRVVAVFTSVVYVASLEADSNGNVNISNPTTDEVHTAKFIVVGSEDTSLDIPVNKNTGLYYRDYRGCTVYMVHPETDELIKITKSANMSPYYTFAIPYYKQTSARYEHNLRVTALPHTAKAVVINNIAYLPSCNGPGTETVSERYPRIAKFNVYYDTTTNRYAYQLHDLTDTKISLREAISTGYNMLATNPYRFDNTSATAWDLLGILPYDATGNTIKLTARKGEELQLVCNYKYKADTPYCMRWEYCNNDDTTTWYTLRSQYTAAKYDVNAQEYTTASMINGAKASIQFSPTVDSFQIRVSLYLWADVQAYQNGASSGAPMPNPQKVMTLSFASLCSDTANNNLKNLTTKAYNIRINAGMCVWKNRAVIWGVSQAEGTLFTSEVNNPSYFPYPNNIDLFDEDIIHCTPFGEKLLVFTKTSIYLLQLNTTGIGFTRTLLQDKLDISVYDSHVIKVVKNMLFFKSGDYYYMMVPKATSITGELVIAPITKPLYNMMKDFTGNLTDIITYLLPGFIKDATTPSFEIVNYYNYLDVDDVRNVYHIRCTVLGTTVDFNYTLNYNTVLRVWTTHIYSCDTGLAVLSDTVTSKAIMINPLKNGVELLRASEDSISDKHTCESAPTTSLRIKNYQIIDTGYRKLADQMKKRFREVQFKLNNLVPTTLKYNTAFYIDSELRKDIFKWETKYDSTTGTCFVERVIDDAYKTTLTTPGTTVLSPTPAQANYWTLDATAFPTVNAKGLGYLKVRMSVSGKGYSPRIILVSYNEAPFELSTFNWVYRLMNAR